MEKFVSLSIVVMEKSSLKKGNTMKQFSYNNLPGKPETQAIEPKQLPNPSNEQLMEHSARN
jgi:hypothetical protein